MPCGFFIAPFPALSLKLLTTVAASVKQGESLAFRPLQPYQSSKAGVWKAPSHRSK